SRSGRSQKTAASTTRATAARISVRRRLAPRIASDAQLFTRDRALSKLLRGGLEDDRALLHDVAPVAHGERDVRVLLAQQYGHAQPLELEDHVADVPDERGRQPLRGLVHQDQPRAGHHHARDREHLLLATGERLARLLDPLAQAREVMEHLVETAAPERGRPVGGGRQAELEVLAHAESGKDPTIFRHEADAEPRDLVRGASREIDALELDRAAPGLEEPDQGLHQGRLAHAVAAQERDRLARAHLERDPEEDRRRSVPGVDVGYFQQASSPAAPDRLRSPADRSGSAPPGPPPTAP